jgi:hypothetical protein
MQLHKDYDKLKPMKRRNTTIARYKDVIEDFRKMKEKKSPKGTSMYSYEFIIEKLAEKHHYTEFMIDRIIKNEDEYMIDQRDSEKQLSLPIN